MANGLKGIFLLVLVSSILVNCSSPAPEETYASQLANAECNWARSCCEVSELSSILGLSSTDPYSLEIARQALGEQGRCVDLVHAQLVTAASRRTLLESVRSGRTKLDNGKLDACLQQFSKAKDSCTIGLSSKSLVEACKDDVLFVGQQLPGGICYLEVDCAPGFTCWLAGGAGKPGICRFKAGDGAACRTDGDCPESDSCSLVDARDSWCAPLDQQYNGQSCSTDDQCADGLFCDTSLQMCSALRSVGQECFQDRQCASNQCNKGTRTCGAQAKESEPCASSASCESALWCDGTQATSICAASVGAAGDACSASAPCGAGFTCVGSICRVPLEDYKACTLTPECQSSSYCDFASYTCKPRKVKTSTCSSSAECAAGLYCPVLTYQCVERAAEGQTCTSTDQCIEGTRCGANWRCTALFPAGSSCSAASDCAQGLLCQHFAGRCASRSVGGPLCDSSDACPFGAFYCGAGGGSICTKALKVGLAQACNGSSIVCDEGLVCSGGTCKQKLPAGAPCLQSSDCADGTYCRRLSGTNVCSPYAGLGAACSPGGSIQPLCQTRTVCTAPTGVGADYTCAPGHAAGESCSTTDDCASGLYCSSSFKCASLLAEGGACVSSSQCGTGLECRNLTCSAKLAENASCAQASTSCGPNLYCRRFSGSCTARISRGQTCQSAGVDPCEAGFQCVSHKICRAKAQRGEACRSDRPCAPGLRCDAEWGKCMALGEDLKLGATCRADEECASGMCSGQQCTGYCQGVNR